MVSIPKSEVDRVSVARKKKARNTAIGAEIGGGWGAAIGGGIGLAGQREDGEDGYPALLAWVGFYVGAVAGALLGLGSGMGPQAIYEKAPVQTK